MEKLLINRIMHHVYTNDFLNHNQFGFTPKESTTDVKMAFTEFVEEGLRQGLIAIPDSMDVKGAFDTAWWPGIPTTLQDFKCPRNLFYLTKNNLRQRTAVMTTHTLQVVRDVSKGCPQGSCCGPGLWNIHYSLIGKLEFGKQTKVIAFADDLLLDVTAESIREAENITNIDMNKVLTWAKNNKIKFNENKSKATVISRRKRKENKDVSIYMNNKILEQA